MQLKDIDSAQWKISPDLKKVFNDLRCLSRQEQEFHLNCPRDEKTTVDCTHQSYILVLSKSKLFTLTEILVSKETEFILGVKGTLPDKGFTVRKNRRVLSEEQKKEFGERINKQRKSVSTW